MLAGNSPLFGGRGITRTPLGCATGKCLALSTLVVVELAIVDLCSGSLMNTLYMKE